MSGHKILTIEEVDKEVEKLQEKHGHHLVVDEHGKLVNEGIFDPQALLTKICAAVTVAKPILQFVRSLLFFKPSWQKVLDIVINSANAVCPE